MNRCRLYQVIRKHRGLFALVYTGVYLLWFYLLEITVTPDSEFHIMHCKYDDFIPFVPAFIIPYLLWFFYIGITLFYLHKKNGDEATKLGLFLAGGMTICLIICTLYPNGTNFRVYANPENGPLSFLTFLIQRADTPTNVFPSIHVYNAMGINAGIWHSSQFKKNSAIRLASLFLMLSICCSTVFLKQHSLLDVAASGILAYFMDFAVYGSLAESVFSTSRAKNRIKEAA